MIFSKADSMSDCLVISDERMCRTAQDSRTRRSKSTYVETCSSRCSDSAWRWSSRGRVPSFGPTYSLRSTSPFAVSLIY